MKRAYSVKKLKVFIQERNE